jgi:hypothetical protein
MLLSLPLFRRHFFVHSSLVSRRPLHVVALPAYLPRQRPDLRTCLTPPSSSRSAASCSRKAIPTRLPACCRPVRFTTRWMSIWRPLRRAPWSFLLISWSSLRPMGAIPLRSLLDGGPRHSLKQRPVIPLPSYNATTRLSDHRRNQQSPPSSRAMLYRSMFQSARVVMRVTVRRNLFGGTIGLNSFDRLVLSAGKVAVSFSPECIMGAGSPNASS